MGWGRSGRGTFRAPARDAGQATVEYLLVGLVLMASIVAGGLLWHVARDGAFVSHATTSASHATGATDLGAVGDVCLY
ncbi:MAG: hypothetical protein ACI364_06915 [Coriobacteriales bacterium]